MIRRSETRITSGRCIMAERPAGGKAINLRHLRMREIEKVLKHRHGRLPSPEVAIEPFMLGIAYAAHAGPERDQLEAVMAGWCGSWAPHLIESFADVFEPIRMRVEGRRFNLNAEDAGALIALTWQEREALGLKTMWASDMPISDQRKRKAALKKRDDADRQREKRRSAGAQPRDEWRRHALSEAAGKPWEALGKSRSWYFEQKRRAKLDSSVAARTREDWTGPSLLERTRPSQIRNSFGVLESVCDGPVQSPSLAPSLDEVGSANSGGGGISPSADPAVSRAVNHEEPSRQRDPGDGPRTASGTLLSGRPPRRGRALRSERDPVSAESREAEASQHRSPQLDLITDWLEGNRT